MGIRGRDIEGSEGASEAVRARDTRSGSRGTSKRIGAKDNHDMDDRIVPLSTTIPHHVMLLGLLDEFPPDLCPMWRFCVDVEVDVDVRPPDCDRDRDRVTLQRRRPRDDTEINTTSNIDIAAYTDHSVVGAVREDLLDQTQLRSPNQDFIYDPPLLTNNGHDLPELDMEMGTWLFDDLDIFGFQ